MERLVFGMTVLCCALARIGVAVQQTGLGQKVCNDTGTLVFASPRALFMPSLLPSDKAIDPCTPRAAHPIAQVGRNEPCPYLATSGMTTLGAVPTTA